MITTRAITAVAIVAFAMGVYALLVSTGTTAPKSEVGAGLPRAIVFKATREPVQRQWRGYGSVDALNTADVPARVTATVEAIPGRVLPGNAVAKGDLLVQLDPTDFERRADAAQQTLADLQAQQALLAVEKQSLDQRLELDADDVRLLSDEVGRIEKLYQRGAANQQDVDRTRRELIAARSRQVSTKEALDRIEPRQAQLEAQIASQKSTLRLAQLELERTRIVSPIDGVIQAVDVEVGENLTPGQRVARVVNLQRLEVPLRLPASARRDVTIGDQVTLTANRTKRQWPATVSRIAPEDDPQTRTVAVYVDIEQPDALTAYGTSRQAELLTPGVFVSGTVTANEPQMRWVVPRRSIRGGRVLTVKDGVLQSMDVAVDHVHEGEFAGLGLPDDQWAVLDETQGDMFQGGELVLVNVSGDMRDGAAVTAVLATTVAHDGVGAPVERATP